MAEEQIQAARLPSDGPTAASLRGENSPFIQAEILPEMGNNVFSGFHQSKRKHREKNEQPGEQVHKLYILEQEQVYPSTYMSLPSPARGPKSFHSWDMNNSEVENIYLLKGEMSLFQLSLHSFDNTLCSLVTSSQKVKGLRRNGFWLPQRHETSVAKSSPQVSALLCGPGLT